MPTYELRCETCGHRFEVFLTRIIRTEDKVCPVCGSDRVKNGIGGGVLGKGAAPSRQSAACGATGFT